MISLILLCNPPKSNHENNSQRTVQKLQQPNNDATVSPNIRTHKITPRSYKLFQALHAKTERMKCSPIIDMQNLLNDHIKQKEKQMKF